MQGKLVRYVLLGVAALILIAGAFSGGVLLGWAIPNQAFSSTLPLLAPSQTTGQEDVDTLFQPFWQAWQIVHDQYVDQPVDNVKLMRGAISGMLASLGDQHTAYMDPEVKRPTPLNGEYEGIGAWVDTSCTCLTSAAHARLASREGRSPAGRPNHCHQWGRHDWHRRQPGAAPDSGPGRYHGEINRPTRR